MSPPAVSIHVIPGADPVFKPRYELVIRDREFTAVATKQVQKVHDVCCSNSCPTPHSGYCKSLPDRPHEGVRPYR